MGNDDDSLTKVHIDLPNHWATGGESLWALPLGDDLCEIRNSPFYAYGINWGDVVRAHSDDPNLKPEVRQVVAPSGNRTLRVFFNRTLTQEEQDSALSSLESLDLSWERADDYYVAIDILLNRTIKLFAISFGNSSKTAHSNTKPARRAFPAASMMCQ